MNYFNHNSPEHDELMQEANYYLGWAFTFGCLGFIAQIVAFIKMVSNQMKHGLIILLVSFATYFMSGRLKRKSHDYFKKAHLEDI